MHRYDGFRLSHWLSRRDWRVYCFFTSAVKSWDVVVLYTEGILEAFDVNKAQYGLKSLWQVVVKNRHPPVQEIREAVINDVRQYIGTMKVFDDITLVVMKQK